MRTDEQCAEQELAIVCQNEAATQASMRLARAEYEGEPCLQVTIKSTTEQSSVAPSTPASEQLELPGFLKAAESFFASSDGYAYILVAQID